MKLAFTVPLAGSLTCALPTEKLATAVLSAIEAVAAGLA